MGRAERRAYNRKHKTNLTREQFDSLIAVARIKAGNFNFSDLKVSPDFAHMDNYDLVPEGCPCKLNYDAIMARPQVDKNPDYIKWIEEHKDAELHVTREGAANSLICFKEDERYVTDPETGETIKAEPWLFDTYTDILIQDTDGVYKTVLDIEEQRGDVSSETETANENLTQTNEEQKQD